MRDEIAKVCEEKNLSYKDIQEMLAADGLNVSIATLRRHLGEKRKGKGEERGAIRKAESVNLQPTPPELRGLRGSSDRARERREKIGTGRSASDPSNAKPDRPGARRGEGRKIGDPSVPRASSFPVRRDREQI